MPGPRCGDLAYFFFKVEPPLVGKKATVFVLRDYAKHLTASAGMELKKVEEKMLGWPDQYVKGGSGHYGGRKVDYRGLNKLSYDARMDKQRFELSIHVGGKTRMGDDCIYIEGYGPESDSFTGSQAKGIPVPLELHQKIKIPGPLGKLGFKRRRVISAKAGAQEGEDLDGKKWRIAKNCGNYHIKLKDGYVTITVKIKLKAKAGSTRPLTGIFQSIKKKAEAFWNSDACGFGQWTYHRNDCTRKDACACPVVVSQGKVKQAGCCKFPLRLEVVEGGDNEVEINFLSLFQRVMKAVTDDSGAPADAAHLNHPESRAKTYAHEIGHMMGFPDQYETGHTEEDAVNPLTGKSSGKGVFPIDNESIMGGGMVRAKKCHFAAKWIHEWVNKAVKESTKALPKAQ